MSKKIKVSKNNMWWAALVALMVSAVGVMLIFPSLFEDSLILVSIVTAFIIVLFMLAVWIITRPFTSLFIDGKPKSDYLDIKFEKFSTLNGLRILGFIFPLLGLLPGLLKLDASGFVEALEWVVILAGLISILKYKKSLIKKVRNNLNFELTLFLGLGFLVSDVISWFLYGPFFQNNGSNGQTLWIPFSAILLLAAFFQYFYDKRKTVKGIKKKDLFE